MTKYLQGQQYAIDETKIITSKSHSDTVYSALSHFSTVCRSYGGTQSLFFIYRFLSIFLVGENKR